MLGSSSNCYLTFKAWLMLHQSGLASIFCIANLSSYSYLSFPIILFGRRLSFSYFSSHFSDQISCAQAGNKSVFKMLLSVRFTPIFFLSSLYHVYLSSHNSHPLWKRFLLHPLSAHRAFQWAIAGASVTLTQYFTVPHRFHPDSGNSTGMALEWLNSRGMRPEWDWNGLDSCGIHLIYLKFDIRDYFIYIYIIYNSYMILFTWIE